MYGLSAVGFDVMYAMATPASTSVITTLIIITVLMADFIASVLLLVPVAPLIT